MISIYSTGALQWSSALKQFSEFVLVALCLQQKSCTELMSRPNSTKQLSTVAVVTCIAVAGVKPVVRMRVGSGQIMELSTGDLILKYSLYIGLLNQQLWTHQELSQEIFSILDLVWFDLGFLRHCQLQVIKLPVQTKYFDNKFCGRLPVIFLCFYKFCCVTGLADLGFL